MANAIPVTKQSKNPKTEPAKFTTVEGGMKEDELRAKVAEIVAAEVPTSVSDESVNQIGQLTAYGKVQHAQELVYEIERKNGEIVQRSAIRVDH